MGYAIKVSITNIFYSVWSQGKLQLRAKYRLPLRMDSGETPIPYGVQTSTPHGFRRNSNSIRSTGFHSAWIQEKYQFHAGYRLPLRTDLGKIPVPYGVQAPTPHGFRKNYDSIRSTGSHSAWIQEKYQFHAGYRLPLRMDSGEISIPCGVQAPTPHGFRKNYDSIRSTGSYFSSRTHLRALFHIILSPTLYKMRIGVNYDLYKL
ncbi:hypothetical protein HNQ35_002493 [Cerasibacillus quisquiliarum]|nr:hypothetical protein [Cerasibacillus quisquiliarum]